MSLSNTTVGTTYACNGVTTTFAIPFAWSATSEIKVYKILISTGVATLQTLTTNYTYSPNDEAPTSIIVVGAAPDALYRMRIERETAITQPIDYLNNSGFLAEDHEESMDRIVQMVQEADARIDNSLKLSQIDYGADVQIPLLVADSVIAINPTGDGFIMGPTVTEVAAAEGYSIAAAASAAEAAASVVAIGDSEATALTAAQEALDSATAALDSETAAAGSAAAAAVSETNAAASEAAIAGAEAATAASAAAAATSETNAALSETNAITAAGNASSSAISASGSAATATTQAGNASTSATNALASEVSASASSASLRAYTTTATAAGTTTLTDTSSFQQYFTGVTTQTITLPVAATMVVGRGFEIVNLSTGALTVNSSGGNLVTTVPAGNSSKIICILASGTTAASWNAVAVALALPISIGNGGTGQTVKANAFNALSPMTTGGDLIYGGASGTGTRLANGTAGQALVSAGGTAAPAWSSTPSFTQISFPATQVPSAGANVLDDYEEGTWTPVVTATAGAIGAYTSSGTYTKVGRMVTVNCTSKITSLGTASGSYVVGGLPFATVNKVTFGARENDVNGFTNSAVCDPAATPTEVTFFRYDAVANVAVNISIPFTFSYFVS